MPPEILAPAPSEIVLDGNSVDRLEVKTTTGRRFFVRPRVTVLACGGIENARLLLASNKKRNRGIGNEFDQVGRYYMDHPKGWFGTIRVFDGVRRLRDDPA